MSKNPKAQPPSSPLRDLAGFVLLALTLFLFLALASYHPMDPSWNTKVAGEGIVIRNICGIVGSYAADFLIALFGYASYLFPVSLAGVTWAVVFRPGWLRASTRVIGFVLLLLGAATFLALLEGASIRLPAWGGVTGHLLGSLAARYAGTVGAYVVTVTFFLLSLVLIGRLTFGGFVKGMTRAGGWAVAALGKLGLLTVKAGRATNELLEKEAEEFGRGLEAIREDEAPAISKRDPVIKIGGFADVGAEKTNPEIPIVMAKPAEKDAMPKFHSLDLESEDTVQAKEKAPKNWKLPDVSLLEAPGEQDIPVDREELFRNANVLENKLKDFGVFGKVVEVHPGPVITMYEFEPAPGIKVNQVMRLNDDLALALKAISVRITPLPGKAVIGIEVANRQRQVVYLKDVVASDGFSQAASRLTSAIGKDIAGIPYTIDLRKMPHLLMAGATGSGKSVSVNAMIVSILYKATPEEVRMILVDPKMLELSLYEGIPHLLLPVVTDPRKAAAALRWAVLEMERRYRLLADLGVRNIEGYNKKVLKAMKEGIPEPTAQLPVEMAMAEAAGEPPPKHDEHKGKLPFIMIVIDELADLMMVASRDVEESIIRLAQMARAAGIHLVLATQRPSVDVITGVIKANMPARISFQVSAKIDSRTILDANGAEVLLGAGDMLYLQPGTSKLERAHGAFVSDNEVKAVTDHWKGQGTPDYDLDILKVKEEEEKLAEGGGEDEDMYQAALNIARTHGSASISLIQRKLRIGYNRAARLVERMEAEGLLAPGEVGKPRELLLSRLDG